LFFSNSGLKPAATIPNRSYGTIPKANVQFKQVSKSFKSILKNRVHRLNPQCLFIQDSKAKKSMPCKAYSLGKADNRGAI
jgi:hypothetical protein